MKVSGKEGGAGGGKPLFKARLLPWASKQMVLIAMSGGVDRMQIAAYLVKKSGEDAGRRYALKSFSNDDIQLDRTHCRPVALCLTLRTRGSVALRLGIPDHVLFQLR